MAYSSWLLGVAIIDKFCLDAADTLFTRHSSYILQMLDGEFSINYNDWNEVRIRDSGPRTHTHTGFVICVAGVEPVRARSQFSGSAGVIVVQMILMPKL